MSTPKAQPEKEKSRVREALETDVFSYLQSKGIMPIGNSGTYYYYRSPLNGGGRGSFIVHKSKNRWIDYRGEAKWDRIISLVMQLEGVEFQKAVSILLNESSSGLQKFVPDDSEPDVPAIKMVAKSNYFSRKMYSYLKFRKINIDVAKLYCKQLQVVFPRSRFPKYKHDFIGFKNDLGGWELRNWKKKRCISPKHYTTIGEGKNRYFFEGFMDYLSYLTYKNIYKIEGKVIVLHSLSLISWVYELMKEPGTNYLFFDNDRTATDKILDLEEKDIPFVDMRDSYKIYNDLNNMLRRLIRF